MLRNGSNTSNLTSYSILKSHQERKGTIYSAAREFQARVTFNLVAAKK
jgi:hypothetical protein